MNNELCLFYFDKNSGNVNTLSIKNGFMSRGDNDKFCEVFNLFVLGKNQKFLGINDGFEVILDLDSGLYHYLKDGVEDIEKLYTLNGENATLFSDKDKLSFEKLARKFKTNKGFVIFFTGYFAFVAVMGANSYFSNNKNYTSSEIIEEMIPTVTAQDIKNAIYSSTKLNNIEKEYLWNEELINDLVPYYEDSDYSNVIINYRFNDLDILTFSEEEQELHFQYAGFYTCDNLLHIRDYESSKLSSDNISVQSNDIKRNTAHEYIHMLEMNYDLLFVSESIAEIMAHEYFLKSSDFSYPYSYDNGCRYIKALMEMCGPDIIQERVFSKDSVCLEEIVQPYFTADEYLEFIEILKISPEEVSEDQYDRLEALMGILYKNKFGADMNENDLIYSILHDNIYNRAYFSRSLIKNSPSYYIKTDKISLEEAYKEGIVSFYFDELSSNVDNFRDEDALREKHAKWAWYCTSGLIVNSERIESCRLLADSDDTVGFEISDSIIHIEEFDPLYDMCRIMDKDDNTFEVSISDAIKLGYLIDGALIQYYVTYDEYLNNPSKYSVDVQKGFQYSVNENVITTNKDIVYVDSIESSFVSTNMRK